MRKFKVLQFPMANAYGGITQYALQNWRYIDKERFQFDFATLSKEKLHFEDDAIRQGCKVFYISCYAEEDEIRFSEELRTIFKEGYDAVHIHTSFWKSFLVEKLAKEAGIRKIIIHSHNTSVLGEKNREENIIRHYECLSKLDETIATDYWACSKEAAAWLYGDRIPRERIVIQKNAIDVDRYQYNELISKQVRKELGWDNCFIIGHVGRFTYQKNHAFLMRVFKEVYSNNRNIRLLLVGIGPEQESIKEMIKEWNLQKEIKILERRDDVDKLLQAIDVFAFPSRFEGFGIALIEAQAAGCYCVASDLLSGDVLLTESIITIPLEEKIWTNDLIKLSLREKNRYIQNVEILKEKGYDIKKQINNIEKGYIE